MYVKTQLNLINWAIGISFIMSALSLYVLIAGSSVKTALFPALMNAAIFGLMLRVRLKLDLKAARYMLMSFGALFVYYLINFFVSLPLIIRTVKQATAMSGISIFPIILSSIVGYSFYLLCGYLYYKVYKATLLINELQLEKVPSDLGQ